MLEIIECLFYDNRTPHDPGKEPAMNERTELIRLLLSLTEEELQEVISRVRKEPDLRSLAEREPPHPTREAQDQ